MIHSTRRKGARVLRSLPVGAHRARWLYTSCWGPPIAGRLRPGSVIAPCAHTAKRADGIAVCGVLTARRVRQRWSSAWRPARAAPRHGAPCPPTLPSGLLRATWPGPHGCGLMESRCMQPRITLITLGVDDLERAVRFYRDGLGLKTDGIVGAEFEYGAVAFFDLQEGLKLALWPRKSIAHDTGIALGSPNAH